MGSEPNPGLLGDRNDLFQKPLQPAPELIARNRFQGTRGCVPVVNHVPDHPVRNWCVERSVHAHGNRAPAPIGTGHPCADSRQTEVVAEHRNPGFAQAADNRLNVLNVLRTLGAIEKNVVPVGRVEVLDGFPDQTVALKVALDGGQLIH